MQNQTNKTKTEAKLYIPIQPFIWNEYLVPVKSEKKARKRWVIILDGIRYQGDRKHGVLTWRGKKYSAGIDGRALLSDAIDRSHDDWLRAHPNYYPGERQGGAR